MTDKNYESKSRLDRMIHCNELDKKFFTAADVLMFIEKERNLVRTTTACEDERDIVDTALALLQTDLCHEASKPSFKYPPYKDITYTVSEISELINEKRETIVDEICSCYGRSSKSSKKCATDSANATLNKVIRYLIMVYEARLRDFAISQVNHYDVDSLYPSDTDNDAVKVTSKDVTIDTPTATITIRQKETD